MGAAEDAGSIESELRLKLTQMEKDALEAQKKMDALAAKLKKQGASAGDGFAAGMKKGFDQVDISAAKLGKSIATKLSPAIIGITVGIKAIQGMGKAIGDAFMSNEKFAKGISDLKSSLGASFTAATKPVSDWFANLIDKAAKSVRQSRELKEALDRLKDENYREIGKNLSTELEKTMVDVSRLEEKIQGLHDAVARSYGRTLIVAKKKLQEELPELEAQLAEARAKLGDIEERTGNASVSSIVKLQEVENEYLKTLEVINYQKEEGAINQQERDEAEISALNNYINKTAELLKLAEEGEIKDSEYNRNFNARIAERTALQEKLKKDTADEEKIADARNKAVEKCEQAEQRARDAKAAGLIDEEEMEKQIHAAQAQKYSDLEAIVLQYKIEADTASEAGKEVIRLRKETAERVKTEQDVAKAKENQKKIGDLMIEQSDTLLQQEIDRLKATAATAKTETERNDALEEAYRLEIVLIERQQYRAKEAIKQSAEYIAASDKERDAILRNFDMITEGMKRAKEKAKNEGGFLESVFSSEGYSTMLQVGEAAIDAFSTISNTALEISRKNAEEQIAIVEATLNSMLEQIEQARQAELEANGFARATSEEEIQKQIDRAKEAGDEVLQYRLERRKEEIAINKKYDDMVKEQEEKAAREKADIEYKLAKQEHAMQIIQAANAAAMAVMQALAHPPGPPTSFVFAALASTAAAAQIGMLIANPPKPPQFADGGIVPGRKSDGDVQHVIATAGEVILNEAQQETVASKLEGRNGYTQLTVIVQVDSREMAQAMADVYGSGRVLIPMRGIAQ